MKLVQIFAMVISALVFLTGCHTPRSEAELFRRKYPDRAKHYYVLEPQSVHPLMGMVIMHQQTVLGILDGVRRRKDTPEKLEKYLERLYRIHSGTNIVLAEFARIQGILEVVGGTLYYFKWRCSELGKIYEEEGFMILRNGEVIYRNGGVAQEIEKLFDQRNAHEEHEVESSGPLKESASPVQ